MSFSKNNAQANVMKTKLIAANFMCRLVGQLVNMLRGRLVAYLTLI
jgi:hypothetical protein